MSYLNESNIEPSLLRTEDLVSAEGNRNHEIMEALEEANKRLLEQNRRLKEHLTWQKENSDWRTSVVLSHILDWFDEPAGLRLGDTATQALSRTPPPTKVVGRASTSPPPPPPPPTARATTVMTKSKGSAAPVKQRKVASFRSSAGRQKQEPSTVTHGDDDKWEKKHLTHGDVWSVKRDEHTIGKPVAASSRKPVAADEWMEERETPRRQQQFDSEMSKWLLSPPPPTSIARKRSDELLADSETPFTMESPDEPPFGSTEDAVERISRLTNVPEDGDQVKRLVGEIGFQLDRRILSYIFNGRHMEGRPERKRFYGFTIGNIPEMIELEATDPKTGMPNSKRKAALTYRYKYIFRTLRPFGYKQDLHPMFTVRIVNNYGLLNAPLDETTRNRILNDPETIRKILRRIIRGRSEQKDANILLDCLLQMACDDGKPLFIW